MNVVVHIPTKNMFVDKVKLTRTLAFLTNAEMLVEFGGRAMPMDVILQKRSNKGNDYLYFLLKFVPALVGYRTWVDIRLKTGLEEYFTNSDEAFLLLCYECYGEKWSHDYNAKTRRTTDGDDTQEEHSPVAKYTGVLQVGSKRRWNDAAKQRFNELMVEVYNDRKRNSKKFERR